MNIRYQIIVEYDGSRFNGWQIQKNGNSIQGTIQSILSKLLKKKIKVYGSGRTDTGVHAIAQSAHFDFNKKINNLSNFIKSCNHFLNKKNISIIQIKKKNNSFHARFSARERFYKYLIRNNISPSVLNKKREWHIINSLDIDLIKMGAKKLSGTHNFSTFRASNCNSKSPVKTIKKISISKKKKYNKN